MTGGALLIRQNALVGRLFFYIDGELYFHAEKPELLFPQSLVFFRQKIKPDSEGFTAKGYVLPHSCALKPLL